MRVVEGEKFNLQYVSNGTLLKAWPGQFQSHCVGYCELFGILFGNLSRISTSLPYHKLSEMYDSPAKKSIILHTVKINLAENS